MVRGDDRCSRFCRTCHQDCICGSCSCCHTCRNRSHFKGGGSLETGYLYECQYYYHICNVKAKESYTDAFISRLKDFPKLFSSEIIEITVGSGPSRELRYVPKSALVEHSEYFKRSFSFHEKAGSQSASTVLETDVDIPDAFDRFIQFMYWNDYIISSSIEENDLDLRLHANVYVLAERLQAATLKQLSLKKATDVALKFSKRLKAKETLAEATVNLSCLPGTINLVYLNTPSPPDILIEAKVEPESPGGTSDTKATTGTDKFRLLIAVFCAHCLTELKTTTGFLECVKGFPDFAADLITRAQGGNALEVDADGHLKI